MSSFFEPLVAGATHDAARRWADDVEQARAPMAGAGERASQLEQDWTQALALGWALALIPETEGGLGSAYDEYAAILEAGGRSGLALPLAQAIGAIPTLLRVLGGAPARSALAALAANEHRATLLADTPSTGLTAQPQAQGWRLHGRIQGAELIPASSHYLAVAAGPDAESLLFWLPAGTNGLSARHYERIDGRLSVDLECSADVSSDALLGRGSALDNALAAARHIARLGMLIESVGAMAGLTEQTAAHLKTRVQFNAPLSNFQVLRHRIADMYVATESSRALVGALVQAVNAEPSANDASTLDESLDHAVLHTLQHGVQIAYASIQMHGGMGMTDELPATRLARRLLIAEFEYGGLAQTRERLLSAALAA